MKIRIKGNSIRLRLTRSEVDAFGRDGYIEERTEFGNNLFIYALRNNPDVTQLTPGFVGIKMTVHVPPAITQEWTTTERVGFSNTYTYDNGKQIAVLLEKDFKCIDAAVTEDQSDNYENPLLSCAPMGKDNSDETYERPTESETETDNGPANIAGTIEEVIVPTVFVHHSQGNAADEQQ